MPADDALAYAAAHQDITFMFIAMTNWSVRKANARLQDMYNRTGKTSSKMIQNKYCDAFELRDQDEIIFIRNSYDEHHHARWLNGQRGTIRVDEYDNVTIKIHHDVHTGKPSVIPWEELNERTKNGDYVPNQQIAPFYASNTWKCQGSEFPNVIVVVDMPTHVECVYTAITRAKDSVHVFAKESDLQQSMTRRILPTRQTQLTQMLRGGKKYAP
jgi:ATP-dependent exoDNAse (exonuclease V) alpha subunit